MHYCDMSTEIRNEKVTIKKAEERGTCASFYRYRPICVTSKYVMIYGQFRHLKEILRILAVKLGN